MASDRIAVLTDAAIDVIAESGMRGLTHRAVDARAAVPVGSTSAYFRTRVALIKGVVRRLADLEQRDMVQDRLAVDGSATDTAPPLAHADLDQMAAGVAARLDRWLSANRNRMLARYACLLEATHRPELRDILVHGATIRTQARLLLAGAGGTDPQWHADQLVAFLDGLLFDRLVGAGTLSAPVPGTAESRHDLTRAVRTALYATVEHQRAAGQRRDLNHRASRAETDHR